MWRDCGLVGVVAVVLLMGSSGLISGATVAQLIEHWAGNSEAMGSDISISGSLC